MKQDKNTGYKELIKAFDFAENYRFSYDLPTQSHQINEQALEKMQLARIHNSLAITKSLTPQLSIALSNVCNSLHLERDFVSAFVYSSSETQASCFLGDTNKCNIMISSSLVNLMDDKELEFVLGHELGHFLLKHGENNHTYQTSKEGSMLSRYKEVSSDRIGFIACGSLESSYSSMIKMLSGLSDNYLRYDISALLDQVRRDSNQTSYLFSYSSHPSLIIRIKALLWFSMSKIYKKSISDTDSGDSIEEVDDQIIKDLDKYIDNPIKKEINDAKKDLSFWLYIFGMIEDDKFEKKEQQMIEKKFGIEDLTKVKEIFATKGRDEATDFINQRLTAAVKNLMQIAPREFELSFDKKLNSVQQELGQKNFISRFKNL